MPYCKRWTSLIGHKWRIRIAHRRRSMDIYDGLVSAATYCSERKFIYLFIYKINDRRTRGPLTYCRIHKNTDIYTIQRNTKKRKMDKNRKITQSKYSPIQFKQKNTKIKWTAQTLANVFWKMTRKVQRLYHWVMSSINNAVRKIVFGYINRTVIFY